MRRTLAAFPSVRGSARARTRSRSASSSPLGIYPGVRAPERSRRASGTASRRSVFTRSPAFWGMPEGATTQQRSFFFVR